MLSTYLLKLYTAELSPNNAPWTEKLATYTYENDVFQMEKKANSGL
jgi:hypothetical protein